MSFRASTGTSRSIAVVALVVAASFGAAGQTRPDLPAADVANIMAEVPLLANVQLAPDGSAVVYSVTRRSVAQNQTTPEILLQPLRPDGGELPAPRTLPAGAMAIRWCPDSACLSLMLPAEDPKRPVPLMRYDLATGRLTPLASGAGSTAPAVTAGYEWSPSGRYIAFTAALAPVGGLDPRRGVPAAAFKQKTRNALFVLELSTGTVAQATPDSLHVSSFEWSPDEQALAAAVRTDPEGFGPSFRTDLVVAPRTGGSPRPLVTRPGIDADPIWSPDGRWIAFATHNGELSYNTTWPGLVPAAGGAVVRFPSDAPMSSSMGWWAPDSRAFFYPAPLEMTRRVVRADVAKRQTAPVAAPKGHLPYDDNFSVSRDGRWMAYTRESLTTPAELFVVRLNGDGTPAGSPRQITKLTPDFPLGRSVRTEALSWPSPDGRFTIHALLLTPESAWSGGRIARPLPTLLNYIGGPSMVRRGFAADGFHGAQLALAARGYAVLVPNTRGRGGYGDAFQRGIRDGKTNARLPYLDAMAGIDLLISRGIADASRLGVFGHSYGGFLTEYTITQTDRFKAAVVHEGHVVGMVDPRYLLFEPDSDNALLARDLYGVHDPFDPAERARLLADSPGYNANRVKTPTLLQFGAKSGVGETVGLVFYNTLRRFDVPAALFMYDEGHVFSRPAAIADDITRTSEWLDHWVRGVPYPDPARQREYESWKRTVHSGIADATRARRWHATAMRGGRPAAASLRFAPWKNGLSGE